MKCKAMFPAARAAARRLVPAAGILLAWVLPLGSAHAQTATSGSIHPKDSGALTWVGTTVSPGGNLSESSCVDSGPAQSCETYTLTVGGTAADWTGKQVQVLLSWQLPANEYDIYIHKGSNSGTLVTSAIQGPGLTSQVATIDPASAGTGVFTIHVAYDTTPAAAADEYHGNVSVQSKSGPGAFAPPPPVAVDHGPAVGYENFEAPGLLTPVSSTSSGVLTVEYMGRGAGEPSVGSDWNTGVANFQSDLQTLFVNFDNSCPVSGASASWVNRRAPTSQLIDSDPIGFTDRQTGRVFAAELTLLSPDTVKISHSDDDGQTWVPDQTGGIASAVDHETLGGGPYHAPLTGTPAYPNAVYYCSQDIAAALCSRSDDGGLTYGPSVPVYNLTQCGGLHGHVKVSPVDGTVYLPNRGCGNQSAVVVSQDNGVTWTIRPIQDAKNSITASSDDPAVGVDANGRVYALFADNGSSPVVATSDDFGATWQQIGDLGAQLGLKNVAFPAAVAGDKGRAAVAFYGTTTGIGDSSAASFTGLWHLFVAHTFDGGASWTTTDATPALPMQRSGLLRGGGADITRNLLDFFDITIDRDGRVLVGYVNGCPGGACSQAAPTATGNGYAATATIARQSSGRRMLAAKDPAAAVSAPGMPFVTQRRTDNVVHLAWNEADSGNSPITGYQILRGTSATSLTPIATAAGTRSSFDDLGATDPTKTYFYKVLAQNAAGASCGNNEVAAPYAGNACSGYIIHQNDPAHPEATGGSVSAPPLPQLLIDSIAVGEPYQNGAQNLMFKMKVGDLSSVPPNSRWRMVWNWGAAPGEQYYVGMTSDSSSAVSFEYGSVATQDVVVLGVPTETFVGAALPQSNYQPDGTITIYVPKSAVGNPQRGDLLGAVNGRTFTADTPETNTLERSTLLVDHTFVKGQADSSYPAATYRLTGNQVTAFGFKQADGVAPGTLVTSAAVTMADVTDPLPISVSNGAYSINGGAFTSAPGLIATGDKLRLQQHSATAAGAATDTVVTVGCYSTSFRSVTGNGGSSSSGGGSSGSSSGSSSSGGGSSSGSSSGGSSSGSSSGGSQAPVANLQATPVSGTAPLTVSFDGSASYDPNNGGSISSYAFDFGDGATASQPGPKASHDYDHPGSYSATLTVTDSGGRSASTSVVISVQSPQSDNPSASLAVSATNGTVPLAVNFDASGSHDANGSITGYSFNFGDGSATVAQSGATTSHTYTAAGTYNASVTVTNSFGNKSAAYVAIQASTTVVVTPPNTPVAELVVSPSQGAAPLTVTLDGSHSYDPDRKDSIASYTFSFGDGSANVTQASPTINHIYSQPGSYHPSLSVTDSAGDRSAAAATAEVDLAQSNTGGSSSGGSSSGGGGAFGGATLLPLLMLWTLRSRRAGAVRPTRKQ